jgi:diguanylate cyclase (GGDEF)-like protein
MGVRSTIAGRISLLLIFLALLASVCISAFLLYREFQVRLDAVVAEVAAKSHKGVQQELAIYFKDWVVLEDLLETFVALPAVDYAAVFDPTGKILLNRLADGVGSYPGTDFFYLRKNRGTLEQILSAPSSPTGSAGYYDLSLPIFSIVKRLDQKIDRQTYGQTLVLERNSGSEHLAGYYHVGINQQWLMRSLRPLAKQIGLVCLVFVLLVAVLTYLVTRTMTAPLASLARMAEDVAAGKLHRKFRFKGTGEVRVIASMLNVVMAELNKHRSKMDTDRHLLSMKVEERSNQLSKRNEELNEAVKQVTQSKNRLHQLAYYDNLTSLPNRQLFTEQLKLILRMAKRENQLIAVLFLDLDNFKRINDSLGHTAGDALLKEVASRLSTCVRSSDLLAKYVDSASKIGVARLGGDEFTIVLNNLDSAERAGSIAKRLLEALQRPMMVGGQEVTITPSIGIALAPQDADTVEELLKLADTAMYHAKAAGRNAYRYYRSSMKSSSVGRLKLENDLRRAVERNELVLYYQPQVNTRTGEIVGAEALVRWNHPDQGLIPPIRFIPLAEEMGLIVELGAWTLMEAVRQIKAYQQQGLSLPKVAVNVSSLQFNPTFIKLVQKVLKEADLEPHYLELELTEGVIMSNATASIEALHELKQLGVSISVDDFGTGYSSLSYLSKFPLDELKIDRSFIIEYGKSERNASLVSAIIAMGKSLNLRLVAEGVETEEQFRYLHDHEVDIIQGYLFCQPVPGEDFGLLLKNNNFPAQVRNITGRLTPVED